MRSLMFPVFPVSVAFVIGLCLGAYVNLLWISAGIFLVILFTYLFPLATFKKYRALPLVILVASSYFQLFDELHDSQLNQIADTGNSHVITGEIETKVKRDGDTVSFTMRVTSIEDHPVTRRQGLIGYFTPDERVVVRVKLTEEEQIEEVNKWFIGDAVTGNMDVSPPEPARNPGSFDYRSYLRWQGIHVVAKTTIQQVKVASNPRSLSGWFDRRQTQEGGLVAQIYRDSETAGYMKSLLLGIQTDITPSLTDIYSRFAQMASFPIIIYWFHQFSLLSWLINLIYVPIISFVILPAGYVSLVVAHIHPGLSFFLTEANTWFLDVLHHWLQKADQLWIPFHHWRHPGWWWYLLYGALCVGIPFLWLRGYHRFRDIGLYIGCFIFLLISLRQPFSSDEQVRITFLDVGQGDSIIVEIGSKKVYLIDGGGTFQLSQPAWKKKRDSFEVGKDTVLPYLRSRGIERIDVLVMTHPDNDHVGGLVSILPYFQIGRAFINTDTPKEAEQKILDYLKQKNVPVYTSYHPVQWEDQPDVRWSWLPPVATMTEHELTGNDASVVLLLSAYGKRILFTGDLERSGEERLIKMGVLPKVDILKAGHHGSKTSSSQELLDTVVPKTAVISVGSQNRYGHPHEEVLKRFSAMNTKVYRTDEDGAISVVISPERIEMKAFLDDN